MYDLVTSSGEVVECDKLNPASAVRDYGGLQVTQKYKPPGTEPN